jgi:uncharacterized protein YjbI with pentapeptide repeats
VTSKAPKTPYPPEADAEPGDDLLDRVVEDADWANRREARFSARRMELVRVRLTGAQLPEGSILDVTFADCRADLVSFRFAKLERVVFRDCRLEESDFYGARLKDVLFERCDLRLAVFSGAKSERIELRGCNLEGLQGIDALRGARMPWNDVLQNAPLFAAALGIEVIDE